MEDYKGKELEVLLPSGFKVSIREQNGDDDDILSNVGNATKGLSYAKFAAAIITKDHRTGMRINYEALLGWKINDLYYLVLASRVYSLGAEIEFKLPCSNKLCKSPPSSYEEDLTIFLTDFSKPQSKEGDPKHYKYQAKSYPQGEAKDFTVTLSSGKVVKLDYLTVAGENEYLNTTNESLSANKQLLVRNIALKTNTADWAPLGAFGIFSSPDMKEIRTAVKTNDVDWEPLMECICPSCKTAQTVSVLHQPDFLFPLGK